VIEAKDLRPGDLYRNKKNGKWYLLLHLAGHSETMEELVIYKPLADDKSAPFKVWARPLSLFCEKFELWMTGTGPG
jgi:hypothetical protein